VVADALRPVAVGIGTGLVIAVALALYVSRVHPELASIDTAVFAAAALGLLLTACVAAAIPSARALRIDPASVLREE
jgi:ABC-type antimicrobial peptide transport system permease subunit